MKRYIYADHAATTKLDKDAYEAMVPYLLEEYGNISQPYSFSRSAKAAIKQARETIADCIHALPEEIYFTSGGTESDNWAIKGSALVDADKCAIITSSIEHHAVLHSCSALERMGYPISYLRVTEDGIITPQELERNIPDKIRLVSIMLANNEIGSIQPITQLSAIAHAHHAIFHTDAVQAVGHIKVDMRELGIDMLSASAHKFNGPKGIGFLYIKKGTKMVPYMDGGAQESGLRAGTVNVAAVIGMAVALKKSCEAIDIRKKQLLELERILIGILSAADIEYVRNGSENHLPGNISLSFKNIDGEMLLHRLDLMGICVSTGAACNSDHTQISHVLQAIGLSREYSKGTIRISFGADNTEEDSVAIAHAIKRIIDD